MLKSEKQYIEYIQQNLTTLGERKILYHLLENENFIVTCMKCGTLNKYPDLKRCKTCNKFVKQSFSEEQKNIYTYLETLIHDTSMGFYSSDTNKENNTQFNYEYYMYYGDIINDTRWFCRARAGNNYSKEEILSWEKYHWKEKFIDIPIFKGRGGKGCRHHLQGFKPEWLTDLYDGDNTDVSTILAKINQYNVFYNTLEPALIYPCPKCFSQVSLPNNIIPEMNFICPVCNAKWVFLPTNSQLKF